MSGRRKESRRFAAAAATLLLAIVWCVPLVGAALAQVPPSSACRLDLDPETDENAPSASHTITVSISNGGGCNVNQEVLEVDVEIISGTTGTYGTTPVGGTTYAGFIDTADTKSDPDATCTEGTGGQPEGTCQVIYTRTNGGVDTIVAWIDNDKSNATLEVDNAEGRNEALIPGDETEQDDTDVVEKTWAAATPINNVLDCDDESGDDAATNPSLGDGSTETYTCTARDSKGTSSTADDTPLVGLRIDAENQTLTANDPSDDGAVAGTADYNDACTTGATGSCTMSVVTEGQTGAAEICFWIDFDIDNVFDLTASEQDGGACDLEVPTTEAAAFGGTEGSGASNSQGNATDEVAKTWETRRPAEISIDPLADTNLLNTMHTITVRVVDQFGVALQGANVDIRVTGRNSRTANDFTTGPEGTVAFTYTDTGSTTTAGNDTISVCTDNVTENDSCPTLDSAGGISEDSETALKRWVVALPIVSEVLLDMRMDDDLPPELGGNDGDSSCPEVGQFDQAAPDANPVGRTSGSLDTPEASVHEICAVARDSSNANIIGQEITFTISGPGHFTNEFGSDLGKTYSTSGDQLGHAHAAITSTETGTTIVTATAGSRSVTGNKTWTAAASTARIIDCEPETATVPAGAQSVVACTATDEFGNPVPGAGVTWTESGPGRFVDTPDGSTGTDGVAEAIVTTTLGEVGIQTITGELTVDVGDSDESGDSDDECDKAAGSPVAGSPAGQCQDSVTRTWTSEALTECNDGVDNDNDGEIDFPDDAGCDSAADDDETDDVFVPRACRNRGSTENVIIGTPGADVLNGTGGRDVICGAGGNDVIDGRGGNDLIVGNGGDDTIGGGVGKDNVSGNAGDDTVSGNRGNDAVKGNVGNDLLRGNLGTDALIGAAGNDRLRGGDHGDVLNGGDGRDNLRGGTGDDALDGGPGTDACFGGPGRDGLVRCE